MPGRFDATLEAPEQLLERLTLAGDHVHRLLLLLVGARIGVLAVVMKRADSRRPASEPYADPIARRVKSSR